MRSSHSFKQNQPSPIVNTNGMIFNSYLKNNYDRNHQSSPDAYNLAISHNSGKSPGCTTPCSAHFSCTPMCHSPHFVPKTLMTQLLPCFHMENVQHSSVTVRFFYLTTKPTYHVIWKPPTHGHPKISAPSHCSHFGPCIDHVNFVVALQPQFPIFHDSLLALLWIPDRPASLLCDCSLTFLVYCWFFYFSPLFFS